MCTNQLSWTQQEIKIVTRCFCNSWTNKRSRTFKDRKARLIRVEAQRSKLLTPIKNFQKISGRKLTLILYWTKLLRFCTHKVSLNWPALVLHATAPYWVLLDRQYSRNQLNSHFLGTYTVHIPLWIQISTEKKNF